MSLDYCGRALGTRQRLPGSSPLATFGSTLGPIGLHLPRVYHPWQQSELQRACEAFSGLLLPLAFGAAWPAWQQDVWLPLLVCCIARKKEKHEPQRFKSQANRRLGWQSISFASEIHRKDEPLARTSFTTLWGLDSRATSAWCLS